MQKIRKDLFPDVIYEGKTYTNGDVSPLVQIVKQEGYKGKIVVSGEGSIGKSTMLTDLRLSMLREERAFVYFNLRDLMDARDVEALADRVNGYKGGDLIVILDSYDETSMTVDDPENSARAKAERLIDGFAARNSVALLVVGARQGCKSTKAKAERDDFGFVGRSYEDNLEFDAWARDRGFKTAMLQRFSDEKLDSILSDRKNISPELRKLLKNTMFLSMYLEAPEKDWESAASEAKFIDKYFDEVFCAKLERQSPEYRGIIKEKLFSIINKIGENVWNGYCQILEEFFSGTDFCPKPRKTIDFKHITELNTIFTQEQKNGDDWEVKAIQEKYLSYCVAQFLLKKIEYQREGIINFWLKAFSFPVNYYFSNANEGLYYTGQLLGEEQVCYLYELLHKTSDYHVFCLLGRIVLGYNKGKIEYGETAIEEWPSFAFCKDSYLKSIRLPANIRYIHEGSFIGCTALEQINISEKNNKYKGIDGNLYSKDEKRLIRYAIGKTEEYFKIPAHVETIGYRAFSESQSLKRITIPGSVKVIDKFAFHDCVRLESVEIMDGVEAIKDDAFSECQALKNITIPGSVKNVGAGAFERCGSLESVKISDGVESIQVDAFHVCPSLKSITIPGSTKIIGDLAFAGCQSLKSVELLDGIEVIKDCVFCDCQALKRITIPGSVKSVGYGAFEECKSLESVEIIDGVESIKNEAFGECRSLKSVTIPGSIKGIGATAFDKCTSLCQINVDENNTRYKSIDGNLYSKDMRKLIRYALGKKEEVFNIPSHVEAIGDCAFSDSHSLKSITIHGNVKEIGDMAFGRCGSLEYLEIPEGVTAIKGGAFTECQSLKSVAIPSSVKTIGCYAFERCLSLKSITIPSGVIDIDKHVFDECMSLCQINVDENNDNYKSINGNLYSKDMKELIRYAIGKKENVFNIPPNVETIGYSAFSDSRSLKKVTIPGNVKAIEDRAFARCGSLEYLEILEGVNTINSKAFEECRSLKKIIIPHGIRKIGEEVFRNCESLWTVYYGGTEKEWIIKHFDEDEELAAAKKYYYSEQEPEAEGNYWHYGEDGKTPVIW